MTPYFLLSIILGLSLGLSDKSLILTPSVFRCNETEIILIHSFNPPGNCLRLQLKSEIDGNIINETGKVLHIEKKKQFQLGVFNDHCMNDYVYLLITSYQAEENDIETAQSQCSDIANEKEIKYKIPIQKDVGYIFIQTDLPIYRSNETVHIRIFRLDENMYPVNTSVVMIIKDPSNSAIKSEIFHNNEDVISTVFRLKNTSLIGVWTISVKYAGKKALKETSIRFLVQDYVMPKFEIDIDVQPKLISKETNYMNVTILAKYFYNKTVDGKVYLTYGNNGDKISGKLEDGQYFQQIEITGERCGSFHVNAKVTEKNTRMTEYKTDSTANFVNSESAPNEEKILEKPQKGNKLYLKKVDEKEFYMQGDVVEVTAENCLQIHYCIIGRGRILKCEKQYKLSETSPITITLRLTEDMIPLAELITYCIHKKRIHSTASLSFKILNICSQKRPLQINILPEKEFYSPQENITIQIKGSHGQTVALSLVDDAVHVISNRYRLTTDFVRKKMLSHNLESFANLKDPNKFRFALSRYNIHEIQPEKKKLFQIVDKVIRTMPLEFEADGEKNEEHVSHLPEALFQTSESGETKVIKYNYFPGSKLFKSYSLRNDEILNVNLTLADSLTRWHIQAISLSKSSPFCVYEPLPIITFKYIVPRLHIPQSVQKYGMFEVKFILYNYNLNKVKVQITLNKTRYICSRENHMTVNVPVMGSTVTKFVAYAMQTGNLPIFVTIKYKDSDGDRIETIEKIISIQEHQVSKPQILTFFLEKTDGFEDSAVSGMTCNERTVLGSIVKSTLQEPEKLMQNSHGSGNQNIIYMAMSVYVLKYILNTKQMNQEIYNNGTKFIRMGIEKQKFFQKNDGSYSTYADTKSSVWLTAFVLKIFCQASEFEEIDEDLTRQAIFWLLKQQKLDGAFEDSSYVHTDIMGGRSSLELTAFVLISLMECRQIHAKEIFENEKRVVLSMGYLETNLDQMNDTLTLAITTYALTLTISNRRISAWQKLTNNFLPWQEDNFLEKASPESVLIASYALLTQLQYDAITIAFSIFHWLIQQKDKNGMFSSTQNTVIALQALAEYSIKWNAPDLDLKIIRPKENHDVRPNATINKTIFFKKTNPSEGSTESQIKITSIGVRSTYIQVLTDFNVFNTKQKNCHFAISYTMGKNSPQKNSSHSLNITFRYNGETSMQTPVMELDLIRGYYMKNNMENHRHIKKLEENGKSALTFFLEKLEPGEERTLKLTLQRGNERKLTPSSIKIYNHDKPDESCVVLYPKEKYFNLFCDSKECLCPGDCPSSNIWFSEKMLEIFCKPNQIGLIVKILHEKKNNRTEAQKESRVIYSAEIKEILMGNQFLEKGKAVVIMDSKCSMSNLEEGKYVIVTDKYVKTDANRYTYWIDDYGFILSYNNVKIRNELRSFEDQIKQLKEKTCRISG